MSFASLCVTLRRLSAGSAIVSLLFLLSVVAYNIVARALFDLTGGAANLLISGAIELAAYALLVMVFGALPGAVPQGLVQVEVLVQRFPRSVQWLLNLTWSLLLTLGAATLTLLFIDTGLKSHSRGALTQDLEIPLWIFYAVTSVQCAILAVISLEHLISVTLSGRGHAAFDGSRR